MATAQALLTAEQYLITPTGAAPTELIGGRVVEMNMPGARHGEVCANIAYLLRRHLEDHDVGRVLANDSGIVTKRNPDSVRGANVSFYSYSRLPKGPAPTGYPAVAPELVFEVLSPSDSWSEALAKAGEYLNAGVQAVCVLDSEARTATICYPDRPAETLVAGDELRSPNILPGLAVPIDSFFDDGSSRK